MKINAVVEGACVVALAVIQCCHAMFPSRKRKPAQEQEQAQHNGMVEDSIAVSMEEGLAVAGEQEIDRSTRTAEVLPLDDGFKNLQQELQALSDHAAALHKRYQDIVAHNIERRTDVLKLQERLSHRRLRDRAKHIKFTSMLEEEWALSPPNTKTSCPSCLELRAASPPDEDDAA